MEGLGYSKAFISTYSPILVALPLRLGLFRRTRSLAARARGAGSGHGLPWLEFVTDLVFWLLIGMAIASIYVGLFHSPMETAVKVMLGCLSFGLLGGMLCYLSLERHIIDQASKEGARSDLRPGRVISVSKKMLFFMVTVLGLMVSVMLLMVFMDIRYLLQRPEVPGADVYQRVFVEIVFAFGVLLALSSLIIARYSQNLRAVLDLQLSAMARVGRGDYTARVPVVGSDEFGLIAAETNEMIQGLEQRDFCQVSFGRYVSPEISEKILRGEFSLQGEVRDVTVLFCDLRGYTPFVERTEPERVVRFLNEYFTRMEQAVKEFSGVVLQYIGDEIEAVFGAPEEVSNHPEMAVRAALRMRELLAAMNKERAARGEDPVIHGVGVHSGEVMAGSVGSPDRLVYALVGDTVNVASRIQDLNKQHGTDILVSGTTRNRVSGSGFRFESLGKTPLRGKSGEVEVFRLA